MHDLILLQKGLAVSVWVCGVPMLTDVVSCGVPKREAFYLITGEPTRAGITEQL
jgi:hypothetical protein